MIIVQVISIVQLNSMITFISNIIFVERHAQICYSIGPTCQIDIQSCQNCRSITSGNLCKNEHQLSGIS